ncbi:MAG: UDP-N-acetylmuramate--L-alanine ligase [Candidatus Eisenbacteria bacterium]|nr:UDP-N-acetylmuramate--L-alanine ligase [Candidatus Eisenbacteria bacterium]
MIQGAIHRVHFIGIGGTGMCGLAEILLTLGYEVSGCDLATETAAVERLERLGARVAKGHAPEHVKDQDLIVVSSAVGSDAPEVRAARRRRIPVLKRGHMLAEIMRLKYGVAVAGAHGKTTTTSLVGHLLSEVGRDPTVVVGGRVRSLASNARLGAGDIFVAEADESDGSFLEILPTLAVVTNIDREHLDHYKNLDAILSAFRRFMRSVPFYGVVVLCGDDPHLRTMLPQINRPVLTYGESPECRIRISDVQLEGTRSRFRLTVGERDLGSFAVPLAGRHNILNATAAVAVGLFLGVSPELLRSALAGFAGVGRRFEARGSAAGVLHLDDYGHHPTEVRAVLAAAREAYRERRIVVLFQPHRYTRTAALHAEFGAAFGDADLVVLTDIHPAGETPIAGVTGEVLRGPIETQSRVRVVYAAREEEVVRELPALLQAGDLLVTLGAGPVWRWGDAVMAQVAARASACSQSSEARVDRT